MKKKKKLTDVHVRNFSPARGLSAAICRPPCAALCPGLFLLVRQHLIVRTTYGGSKYSKGKNERFQNNGKLPADPLLYQNAVMMNDATKKKSQLWIFGPPRIVRQAPYHSGQHVGVGVESKSSGVVAGNGGMDRN